MRAIEWILTGRGGERAKDRAVPGDKKEHEDISVGGQSDHLQAAWRSSDYNRKEV